jgi:UPF0716 protein FxsA
MFLFVLVFLLVAPVVELAVMAKVASVVGVVPTLALVLAVSLLGIWLVRRQGVGVWRRGRGALHGGAVPTSEMLDGLLLLAAGVLLLTPGFVTDAVGLVLLVPPVRSLMKLFIAPRLQLLLRVPFFVAGTAARNRASTGADDRASASADDRVRVGRAVIVTSGTELAGDHQTSAQRDRGNGPFGDGIPGSVA